MKISNKKIKQAGDKCRKSLVAFRFIALSNDDDKELKSAEFHWKLSNLLLRDKKSVAIEAFRESGKTSYVMRAYPLYCLAYPKMGRDYLVLIKNNATLARKKLKEIEEEYLSNPLLMSRMVKIKEQSSDVFSVDIKDDDDKVINIRIEAYGKGSSIRGLNNRDRRPSIVICDDLQDLEDTRSETIPETDWKWFLSDVAFLGKHTRIFMIANNLGAKSIIERIFDDPESVGFETLRIPAEENGVPSWEEMINLDELAEEKEKYRKMGELDLWYRERMCVAIADETRTFKKEDFRYYNHREVFDIARGCNVFIRTDLAVSEKKTADYSVITTLGIDEDNTWYVLDCAYGRWDVNTTLDEMFKAVLKWKPLNVGIEKVAFQAVIESLILDKQRQDNVFFKLVEEKADKQKELRINALQPRFKANTILFPQEAGWLAEMEAELLMFPKAKHDDLIDTLAYFEQDTHRPQTRSSYRHVPRNQRVKKVGRLL